MWTASSSRYENIHFVAPLDYFTLTEDEVDNSTFENVTFAVNQLELPSLMEQGGAVPAGTSAGGLRLPMFLSFPDLPRRLVGWRVVKVILVLSILLSGPSAPGMK